MIWAHDASATRHPDPLQRFGIQKKRTRSLNTLAKPQGWERGARQMRQRRKIRTRKTSIQAGHTALGGWADLCVCGRVEAWGVRGGGASYCAKPSVFRLHRPDSLLPHPTTALLYPEKLSLCCSFSLAILYYRVLFFPARSVFPPIGRRE